MNNSIFFQTNSTGAAGLLQELREIAPQARSILDLYCGVGTLGLALAKQCNRLLGIESVGSAVADAQRNAQGNGITHARFETAKTEEWFAAAHEERPDLVIVDPPRAGLHPRTVKGLIALAPPAIIYVSCNPATLARDLAALTAEGYQADRMRILDLFPHTPHVETIVRLLRPVS